MPKIPTPGEHMLSLADPPGLRYKSNPALWARERARIELWSKQREIIGSVRDNRLTAVHSCHETGKSFTAATTVAWWLDIHKPGEARVVTTAPTGAQVKAVLWYEINQLHKRAGLAGRTNLTEWYMDGTLVAFGRKPSDYSTSAFQGIHARYFLVVLDEACGIPKSLWDSASTLAANEYSRILAIGNPDDVNTEFGENCKPDSGWNVIKIGYQDTPNFTGEPVSQLVKDSLIHEVWVEERAKKWGRESALFQSKCEGIFPTIGDPYAVVPYAWANQCRYNELPETGDVIGGIDVGGGGDRTVLQLRRGMRATKMIEFIDADPMRTVGRLAAALKEHGVTRVTVDSTGIGWGIYGRLRELSTRYMASSDAVHDAEVIGVNFAEASPLGYQAKYLNMRAYMHWEVGREFSRLKLWDLTQVDDDTIHELTTPRYEIIDSAGKIKIELKKEVKKRTGSSPDHSDALLLCFLDRYSEVIMPQGDELDTDLLAGVDPRDSVFGRGGYATPTTNFDPFDERPF